MYDRIVLRRSGMLTAILQPPEAVRRLVENALTYERREYLRGKTARWAQKKFQITPVHCYQHVSDPDDVVPSQLVFPSGFIPRVAGVLKRAGYRVFLKDTTPKRPSQYWEPQWDAIFPKVTWRYRQKEVLEKMLAARVGGQIICPTGYGKGLLIRCFCQLLPHLRIDVSTHSLDVLEQIYADLSVGIPGVSIDCSSFQRKGEGSVRLYSGKSLHHSDGMADVLIVDEGHEWATDAYMASLVRYRNAKRFMFTASPIRDDGAHFELEGAFGPPLVNISYQEAVEHNCIVPILVQMVDVVMDENPAEGYSETARERWGIWRNRVRNEVIADTARKIPEDQQVLITVKTFEHAAFLKKHLPEFTLCYADSESTKADFSRYVSWGLIPSSEVYVDRERRRELKEAFESGKLRRVIATPVWNRGVNFKDLSVLIRADASDSTVADTQIPGRTARLPHRTDKPYGLLIDFLDQFDIGYHRKALRRKKRYEANSWKVERVGRAPMR